MPDPTPDTASQDATAKPPARSGLVAFLAQNKAWWIVPIVVTLLLVVALVALSSQSASPFIYRLF